jgi:hypothetical protein
VAYKKFVSVESGELFYFKGDSTLYKRTETGFTLVEHPEKWGIARDDTPVVVVNEFWAPVVGFFVRYGVI